MTVLTATAAAAVALTSQAAHADPKPTKSEVKAKVDKLYHEAEVATEKANGAKEQQDKLKKQADALQDKVARGQLDQLTAKQAESLQKIQAKQRTLAQQRQEAQGKLADLADVRKTLNENKKKYQGKLADAQKLLNTLTAAERAKMAEDEQRASRAAGDRVELGNEVPASARGAAALQAAATQLGKPYVSGGSGPNSFDCSGLTQWAYAQAGVQITRTTYTQVNDGVQIGRSALKPGDLVFFSNTSHVGLYAGNNQVLHAPYPGQVVRYEAMEYLGAFQFGVRV
ncbi:C40 family peptidase [Streptomyces atroolivaceus]|uniref:C40 family peptidase n=1 Tax=Streptomyces atroolivaceus TaxID=66869 RepID=UPI00052524A8|nr:C40 family peptidase [Streptomyces atroolivaceus]